MRGREGEWAGDQGRPGQWQALGAGGTQRPWAHGGGTGRPWSLSSHYNGAWTCLHGKLQTFICILAGSTYPKCHTMRTGHGHRNQSRHVVQVRGPTPFTPQIQGWVQGARQTLHVLTPIPSCMPPQLRGPTHWMPKEMRDTLTTSRSKMLK